MTDEILEPAYDDIAGVDLIGFRQDDGTMKLGSGRVVDAFPTRVALAGGTYLLEAIRENDWEGRAEVELTNPSDSRLKICWGVYV